MERSTLVGRWTTQVVAVLGLLVFGCGTSQTVPSQTVPISNPLQEKILYSSTHTLDSSGCPPSCTTSKNIWVVNPDGTGATPLTRLTAGWADSANPVWSPDGTKIAFSSARALDGSDAPNTNSALNIWVMNADGTGAMPLTRLTASGEDAANGYVLGLVWSPDGTKIAFGSRRALDGSDAPNTNLASNIWVVNADGTGATPLTRLTAVGWENVDPVWSPDGTRIAFTSQQILNHILNFANIWVMNADGTGAAPLTPNTSSGSLSYESAWSPDGTQIAFASTRALDGSNKQTAQNIWVMNAGTATPLTRLTSADSELPAWSPDGAKIVFSSARALDGSDGLNQGIDYMWPSFNVWIMNADGSGATPLTRLTVSYADSINPVWSPGGTKIAFDSDRALDGSNATDHERVGEVAPNIWVINADGAGAIPLTRDTADYYSPERYNGRPQWRP